MCENVHEKCLLYYKLRPLLPIFVIITNLKRLIPKLFYMLLIHNIKSLLIVEIDKADIQRHINSHLTLICSASVSAKEKPFSCRAI